MSYNKYVLLSVEEHEDLVKNRNPADDSVNKILEAPMENDVKLSLLQQQISSLVKKRNNEANAVKEVEKEKEVEKQPEFDENLEDDVFADASSNFDDGVHQSRKEKLLERLYHDPKYGLRGATSLLSRARKIDPTITRKDVNAYLHSNDGYTRHFHKTKDIVHNPWVASGPDSHHMADLAMLPTLKKYNSGFCYILVVVDVFSRFVFARPLKNKECMSVTLAYEDILEKTLRIPKRLYTDKGKLFCFQYHTISNFSGTEFMGKHFRNLCKELAIVHMNPKNTNVKACYAENAIMRIKNKLEKWFTVSQSYEWLELLPKIVEGLNTTYMDSIGTTPELVTWKNAEKVWKRLYGSPTTYSPKYKIGDTVRILLENSPFAKGTRAKWTEEVFKVVKILNYDIPVYILCDTLEREVDGIWYEEEMVLYNKPDNLLKIDKIIRKRTKKGIREVFVSFKGHSDSFNCWLPESDLISHNG
ncbi:hypothetical protein CRE_19685 [Caenorhabditis remanei]|uniref:Integrase catalytic domain-containing protein n=1 Tax=Caenorhabditis remanei TaxID=31234 RepID=E3MD43_CAERE|nr:hypothetical protein CRE_19685 [Caenorhabditis remanei]